MNTSAGLPGWKRDEFKRFGWHRLALPAVFSTSKDGNVSLSRGAFHSTKIRVWNFGNSTCPIWNGSMKCGTSPLSNPWPWGSRGRESLCPPRPTWVRRWRRMTFQTKTPLAHLSPKKFSIGFVFNFSWDGCDTRHDKCKKNYAKLRIV